MKTQSRLGVTIPQSYKVYTALLSQSGTDAPTAVILENTIGNIVWTYIGTGSYEATSVGLFTLNKTVFNIEPRTTYTFWQGTSVINKDFTINNIRFYTLDSFTNFNTNGRLRNTFVEIRVYP